MQEKPYHHGDLKKALIENGLDIIKENGIENLSLRKTAERCGVSSAAPYAHFKSKEDLINSIRDHVMELFIEALEISMESADRENVLSELGKAYVLFFYHSPLYFDLLFSRSNMHISISEKGKSEPPFELFRNIAEKILGNTGLGKKDTENKILAMWGMVHGLAAASVTEGLDIDIDWETRTGDIINSLRF